eukprot:CAMPEP_0180519440 /NCGR_PEP_ID=MMETSP1036_2-20121128/55690_1 /TAXON_ID=632150 /ORGANISM="Azadinium spinosum, Strain 3D9" /LENGTH=44 /DNA_ID= /DNA_START= /DNA_END= /DNA_ORIENTATION=
MATCEMAWWILMISEAMAKECSHSCEGNTKLFAEAAPSMERQYG